MQTEIEQQKLVYEKESKQKTLTAAQLHASLAEIIAAGQGDRPVFIQDVRGGLTHAIPVILCYAPEYFDGELVWLIHPDE